MCTFGTASKQFNRRQKIKSGEVCLEGRQF